MKDAIPPLMANENVEIVRRVWEAVERRDRTVDGEGVDIKRERREAYITAGAMNATR